MFPFLVHCRSCITFGKSCRRTKRKKTAVKQFNAKPAADLTARWQLYSMDVKSLPVLAAALDPCFKTLGFLSSTEKVAAIEALKCKLKCQTSSTNSIFEPVAKLKKCEKTSISLTTGKYIGLIACNIWDY